MNAGAGSASSESSAQPAHAPAAARKPRFAIFIATAAGLGNIPIAPGTFGSLGGLLLAVLPFWAFIAAPSLVGWFGDWDYSADPVLLVQTVLTVATAAIGVWVSTRAAHFWQRKDPQRVVIDEVSGQHLTLLLGCGTPLWWKPLSNDWGNSPLGLISFHSPLNWKYLLLGLILFRVFDIWKPFPVRQAESLPGGWGIMADDWVAAVYAAIGLWIARAAGL
ncbi:MAG TPA: phosphatidylglycerophosphatase A [Candidatus Acidoferrales bacterium]|nr:phosphatidylglycerophosphatase A [Candidatus Acidoferrales bacterium]